MFQSVHNITLFIETWNCIYIFHSIFYGTYTVTCKEALSTNVFSIVHSCLQDLYFHFFSDRKFESYLKRKLNYRSYQLLSLFAIKLWSRNLVFTVLLTDWFLSTGYHAIHWYCSSDQKWIVSFVLHIMSFIAAVTIFHSCSLVTIRDRVRTVSTSLLSSIAGPHTNIDDRYRGGGGGGGSQ